jgi:hypothetical protein
MGKGINTIGYLLPVFCMMLFMAGFLYLDSSLPMEKVLSPIGCSHDSGQSEQLGAEYPGDEFFAHDSMIKPGIFPDLYGIPPHYPHRSTSSYSGIIWQPPKFSV